MTNPEEFLRDAAQRSVDTGRNRFPSTRKEAVERATATKFLSDLRSNLAIKNIYYPGCSADTTPEPAFTGLLTYLDRNILRRDAGRFGLLGDFINPPQSVRDNSFDAVYISDLHLHLPDEGNHSSEERLAAILQKVKPGGVLIYGIRRICSKWQGELEFLQANEELTKFPLPYSSPNFAVFGVKKPR
jgi:SAM-dependent methyltransferase